MEKNSFVLRSSGEQRASAVVPVERPWNPPARRLFSSREQLANNENTRQLDDYVRRIDDPPTYLHDDSRLHRPFSNSRFGAVRIPSAEAPGIETDERASLPHPQNNLSGQASLQEDRTDRSDSQGHDGSESHQSSLETPSFSDIQDFIDSTWSLNRFPEQLQENFDRMKEEIQNKISQLSKERRRCSNLSGDVEGMRQELNEFREREKEMEIQLSNQDRALKVESSNVNMLREENEKLKEKSRKDHDENEKTRSKMRLEIDTLSKDLEVAKRDIRFKEKILSQIQRDMKNAKQEFDEEVERRERAETESNGVKQECAELQVSYREEKREWITLQEDNEAQVTKLEKVNESQREKISSLEIAVERQKETRQAVESDLIEMVSFLRRVSRAVQQVFHALSLYGCLGVSVTIDFPDSALILEEHEKSYDIFERLVEALDGASSLSAVLELAHPYDDALKKFFRILVVRLVAQSEYVYTSDEGFRQIQSCHNLIRTRLQEQKQGLQDVCENLSSQFNTLREERTRSAEQLFLKVRQVEGEKERVKLELQTEKDRGGVIISMLRKFRQSLAREKATLLDLKGRVTAHYQELKKSGISKDMAATSSWVATLEEVKSGIESLCVACSAFVEKRKIVENTLRADMARLRAALAEKEAKITELTEREAELQKAKNELSSHSRQAIADEEEREKRTSSLKHDIEKLMAGKNEAVHKLADAEHALQQMSGTIAEAFSAKQEALEALIHEKRLVEQLRSELAKVSSEARDQPSHQHTPVESSRKVSSAHLRNETKKGTEGESAGIQGTFIEQSKRSPLPLTAKRTSSAKLQRDSSEADLCEDDFVPKKKKKRTSISHPRKSPRQKAPRTDLSKSITAGKRSELQNPTEVLGSKESVEAPAGVHDTSSNSTAGRDEEWDIELVIGNAEG